MVYISKPEFEIDPWSGKVNAEVRLQMTLDDASALHGCMSSDSVAHVILSALRKSLYRGMFDAHYIGTITDWGYRSSQSKPEIERVIFHDPATIVYWKDGTKSVVKANNEKFDKEKGLLAAIAKKVYGNKGSFNNIIKHFVKE